MPPKAPSRRQPRRGVRSQAIADIPAAPGQDVVEESDQDISVEQSRALNMPSPSLTTPDQSLHTAESLQPSNRLKRNLSALEAPIGANSDGLSSKPSLKYQPRSNVTRRTRNELEAQKKLEQERRLERIAEAKISQANSSQKDRGTGLNNSRGRGYAGRGSGSSRGTISRDGLASGPLGDWRALTTSRATNRPPKPTKPREETVSPDGDAPQTTSSTTTTVKKEPGVAPITSRPRKPRQKGLMRAEDGVTTSKTKNEEIEIVEISSDEDTDYGSRVNIEDINVEIEDESEDDDAIPVRDGHFRTKTPVKPGWATRPVRVDRSEHVPRSVGVNTDASSGMSAEMKQRSREKTGETGDISAASELATTGFKGKSKEVEIVGHERRWRGVYEDEDEEHPTIKEEPEDDMNVDVPPTKPTTAQVHGLGHSQEEHEGPPDGVAPPKTSRRKKLRFQVPKGIFQTDEDRKEWSRHEQDVRLLTEELSKLHRAPVDYDGNGESSELRDRLYVFQFPALTPLLSVKTAPENVAIVEADVTPIPIPRGRESKTPVTKADMDEPTPKPAISAANAQLPGGHVGKLMVRQSGRVTLDWGGTNLELGRGAESDFLQDAVVVPREGDEQQLGSTCWALSQISGKFIVTPDWESIFS